MANLKQLWRASLLFRRVTAGCVFVLAALLVYLGSHIPRSVSLPVDDLNAKSMARIREEQIIIKKPDIAPGDLALSYVGSANEVADIWLENATLDANSRHQLFPHSAVFAPGKISYTVGSVPSRTGSGDTCHTTIEIRRAQGSAPLDALTLFQTDEMAGAQRFRQVILDASTSTMEIEVHTDSPTGGAMGLLDCHKLLTVGGGPPVDLPPIPVHMLVYHGKIDLRFNPANPALPIWTGPKQTFEAVSLGDGRLRGSGLQVVATQYSIAPRLDVRTRSSDSITFSRLKLGSDMLKLDIGRDAESLWLTRTAHRFTTTISLTQSRRIPILSFAFATVLVPTLWKWIRKNCFPNNVSE